MPQKITNLAQWVADQKQLGSIPSYDLKEYTNSVQQLTLDYDDKKKQFVQIKFRFSHEPKSDLEPTGTLQSTGEDQFDKPLYHDRENEYLQVNETGNIFLKNLHSCTVVIPRAASIALESCTGCLFEMHSISFIFVFKLTDSILTGTSQQLRIHDSAGDVVAIQMTGANRIIIENCQTLQVVSYGSTVDDFDHPNQMTSTSFMYRDQNWLQRLEIERFINERQPIIDAIGRIDRPHTE